MHEHGHRIQRIDQSTPRSRSARPRSDRPETESIDSEWEKARSGERSTENGPEGRIAIVDTDGTTTGEEGAGRCGNRSDTTSDRDGPQVRSSASRSSTASTPAMSGTR